MKDTDLRQAFSKYDPTDAVIVSDTPSLLAADGGLMLLITSSTPTTDTGQVHWKTSRLRLW